MMAEQFAIAADEEPQEAGEGSAELNGSKEEPLAFEAAADNQTEGAEQTDGPDVVTAMKQMLLAAESQPAKEWSGTWSSLVTGLDDQCTALTTLFELALRSEGGVELAPAVVGELASSKSVELKSVEGALQALAERLEEFVKMNENAWHLHSHILVQLFPKTQSTTWGFQKPGWTWTSWWLMAERVLSAADHFRAFDILVLVLQMMQEKSSTVIKKQQVWKEGGRTTKVQKILCSWGEMDSSAIVDTLTAYGVEL